MTYKKREQTKKTLPKKMIYEYDEFSSFEDAFQI